MTDLDRPGSHVLGCDEALEELAAPFDRDTDEGGRVVRTQATRTVWGEPG